MQDFAAIHASALVIDAHADTPQRFLDEGWHFTDPLGTGMINLQSARAGNLAAEFFAVWVDPTEHPPETYASRALQLTEAVLDQVRLHPADLRLALTPEDILAARREGRFAVLLGLEGGHSIENSLDLLRRFHALGVRYMTLTWSNSCDWAESSGPLLPPSGTIPHGLSLFGRAVICEMNRMGMMIDVSHVSDRTFWQVMDMSSAPVIASHSSARALTPAPRNLSDNQLRALARKGGVAMVNFFPGFIDERWRRAWEASREERSALHEEAAAPFRAAGKPVPLQVSTRIDRIFSERIGSPPLESLIEHFEHVIEIAGIDHVGLGSDFDGIPSLPAGLHSAADLPRITEALSARGHSAEDLHKLLGGNLLRVFRDIQAAAGEGEGD